MALRIITALQVSIAASLIACGGEIELQSDAAPRLPPATQSLPPADRVPVGSPPPAKLEAIPTDIDDALAQAICRDVAKYRASGTFSADPFFGVSDATSVSARLDEYYMTASPSGSSAVTLSFHLPIARGDDPAHGASIGENAHLLRLSLDGNYPDLAPGTYENQSVSKLEHRSLCYADGLGVSSDDPASSDDITGAKVVITAYDATTIEGTITTQDGAHRLDFKSPIALSGYPKEGAICCFGDPIAPGTPPKLAPACASKPGGTFTADPAFGFEPGTTLEVFVDKRYLADGGFGVFLRLELRGPSTPAKDVYGDTTHRHRTTLTVPLETTYPTIPPGTYSAFTSSDDEDEVCHPDGLGYATALPKDAGGDGKLIVTSQSATEIAGVLDIGGKRLDFHAPITPTPDEVPTRPSCCRE